MHPRSGHPVYDERSIDVAVRCCELRHAVPVNTSSIVIKPADSVIAESVNDGLAAPRTDFFNTLRRSPEGRNRSRETRRCRARAPGRQRRVRRVDEIGGAHSGEALAFRRRGWRIRRPDRHWPPTRPVGGPGPAPRAAARGCPAPRRRGSLPPKDPPMVIRPGDPKFRGGLPNPKHHIAHVVRHCREWVLRSEPVRHPQCDTTGADSAVPGQRVPRSWPDGAKSAVPGRPELLRESLRRRNHRARCASSSRPRDIGTGYRGLRKSDGSFTTLATGAAGSPTRTA